MTRFVAALLIARGPAVTASVDPRTPEARELGPVRSAALLIQAHREGQAQRRTGVSLIAEAGHRIRLRDHQQQRGEQPCT